MAQAGAAPPGPTPAALHTLWSSARTLAANHATREAARCCAQLVARIHGAPGLLWTASPLPAPPAALRGLLLETQRLLARLMRPFASPVAAGWAAAALNTYIPADDVQAVALALEHGLVPALDVGREAVERLLSRVKGDDGVQRRVALQRLVHCLTLEGAYCCSQPALLALAWASVPPLGPGLEPWLALRLGVACSRAGLDSAAADSLLAAASLSDTVRSSATLPPNAGVAPDGSPDSSPDSSPAACPRPGPAEPALLPCVHCLTARACELALGRGDVVRCRRAAGLAVQVGQLPAGHALPCPDRTRAQHTSAACAAIASRDHSWLEARMGDGGTLPPGLAAARAALYGL